jgi:hypothetical protein
LDVICLLKSARLYNYSQCLLIHNEAQWHSSHLSMSIPGNSWQCGIWYWLGCLKPKDRDMEKFIWTSDPNTTFQTTSFNNSCIEHKWNFVWSFQQIYLCKGRDRRTNLKSNITVDLSLMLKELLIRKILKINSTKCLLLKYFLDI